MLRLCDPKPASNRLCPRLSWYTELGKESRPRISLFRSDKHSAEPVWFSALQLAHHLLLPSISQRTAPPLFVARLLPGEGFHPIGHPIRPHSRPRRRPPRCLHHFVGYPPKKEGVGPRKVLGRVTMQVFVRGHCTMIAAPVQCDVDGIPKGSHW
jgi:hypothetical protein